MAALLVKSFGAGIKSIVLLMSPVVSSPVRSWSHEPETVPLEQSAFGPLAGNVTGPYTLICRSWPVYGVPFGFVAGATGLPARSTTGVVGVLPVVGVVP